MSDARAFVFGKLPGHGDFVARGLAPAEREACDAWLSSGLEAAQVALGKRFEAAYGAAPPWRFVFGPGALGSGWRAGALSPSIDRAGRRFPVVAGWVWTGPPAVDLDAAAGAAEAAIYASFEDGGDVDDLLARLCNAALPPVEANICNAAIWTLGGELCEPMRWEGVTPDASLLVRAWTPQRVEARA